MSLFLYAVQVSAPLALIVALGVLFRHLQWIDEAFSRSASKLVFNVSLPSLLFVSIVTVDSDANLDMSITGFAVIFTLGVFMLLSLLSPLLIRNPTDRGVFVQGALSGNMGIVGLGFCLSAFGAESAPLASLYLAFMTLFYNVLSVITLHRWANTSSQQNVLLSTVKGLITNPLIVAIIIATLWRHLGLPVPGFLLATGNYLAQMTLPLALLSIGATLTLAGFRAAGKLTAVATALKIIILPLVAAAIGYLVGFRGMELGIMFLMMATPTAAASYMMVRAIGGNATLAASMIAVSTVMSLFTSSLGLILLMALGWV